MYTWKLYEQQPFIHFSHLLQWVLKSEEHTLAAHVWCVSSKKEDNPRLVSFRRFRQGHHPPSPILLFALPTWTPFLFAHHNLVGDKPGTAPRYVWWVKLSLYLVANNIYTNLDSVHWITYIGGRGREKRGGVAVGCDVLYMGWCVILFIPSTPYTTHKGISSARACVVVRVRKREGCEPAVGAAEGKLFAVGRVVYLARARRQLALVGRDQLRRILVARIAKMGRTPVRTRHTRRTTHDTRHGEAKQSTDTGERGACVPAEPDSDRTAKPAFVLTTQGGSVSNKN